MRNIYTLILLLVSVSTFAQYTTPNTGVNWNFDSLVTHSNGAVILLEEHKYQITEDITIALNDSLVIPEPEIFAIDSIFIDADITITFEGNFTSLEPNIAYIATDIENPYRGFRFESTSSAFIDLAHFLYGGGIKVLTADFTLNNCWIRYFDDNMNTGGALEISTGIPMIINNIFQENKQAGISSAANAEVAPLIMGNWFMRNNTANSNRPQINMGPSGANDTTRIFSNWILGDTTHTNAGGIAFSSLFGSESNVIISYNTIYDNRYGIAVIGNGITALVDNNTIYDNDTQGDPMLGGSGINFNASGSSSATVSNNTITGNLWGITVQGEFEVNLGDQSEESPGHNTFDDNGNNGQVYALYNNTPNPISAFDNCWISTESITLAQAENVIFHQNDDSSLGLVSFDPMWNCGAGIGIEENQLLNLTSLFPNPANSIVNLQFDGEFDQLNLYSINGQLIYSQNSDIVSPIQLNISDLEKGIYLIELKSVEGSEHLKFVKE